MNTKLELSVKNLTRVENQLKKYQKETRDIVRLAVNDTAKQARTRLDNKAQEKYAIKAAGFNKAMKIRNANNSNLTAVITANGRPIPLYRFKQRKNTIGKESYYVPSMQVKLKGKGGKAARGQQLANSSLKELKEGNIKAFVAKIASGNGKSGRSMTGIFQRVGKERLPIKQFYGSSIPVMLSSVNVYDVVAPNIQDDLRSNVERHIGRILSK